MFLCHSLLPCMIEKLPKKPRTKPDHHIQRKGKCLSEARRRMFTYYVKKCLWSWRSSGWRNRSREAREKTGKWIKSIFFVVRNLHILWAWNELIYSWCWTSRFMSVSVAHLILSRARKDVLQCCTNARRLTAPQSKATATADGAINNRIYQYTGLITQLITTWYRAKLVRVSCEFSLKNAPIVSDELECNEFSEFTSHKTRRANGNMEWKERVCTTNWIMIRWHSAILSF